MKKRSKPLKHAVKSVSILITLVLISLIVVIQCMPTSAHAAESDVTTSLSADHITIAAGQTVTITEALNGTDHLLDYDGHDITTFTTVIGYDSSAFVPAATPVTGTENTLTAQIDYNASYAPGHVYYSGYSGSSSLNALSGGSDNKINMVSCQFTASAVAAPGTYRFYLTPDYNSALDANDYRTYMNTYALNGEWQLESSGYIEVTIAAKAEITGFAAIPNVNAGNAGAVSSSYSTASSVNTYLLSAYPNVTGNYLSGTVSVPVTAWVDTDGYNPNTAGSYTFTATLGELPSIYANEGDYTATVEVVVSAGTPTLSFMDASGLWFTTYTDNSTTYDIIRYGSSSSVQATVFKNDMTINNGYVEIYKNETLLISTATGSTHTTSTTAIGTGIKVVLYDSNGTVQKNYYVVLKGDVDGDGAIRSADTNKLRKYVASPAGYPFVPQSSPTPAAIYKYAADVNYTSKKTGDGAIRSSDTSRLLQSIGNPSMYPINQTRDLSN